MGPLMLFINTIYVIYKYHNRKSRLNPKIHPAFRPRLVLSVGGWVNPGMKNLAGVVHTAQQTQQAVENRDGVRGATRNVQIHWDDCPSPAPDFAMSSVWPS